MTSSGEGISSCRQIQERQKDEQPTVRNGFHLDLRKKLSGTALIDFRYCAVVRSIFIYLGGRPLIPRRGYVLSRCPTASLDVLWNSLRCGCGGEAGEGLATGLLQSFVE